jgi:hypothetical protein
MFSLLCRLFIKVAGATGIRAAVKTDFPQTLSQQWTPGSVSARVLPRMASTMAHALRALALISALSCASAYMPAAPLALRSTSRLSSAGTPFAGRTILPLHAPQRRAAMNAFDKVVASASVSLPVGKPLKVGICGTHPRRVRTNRNTCRVGNEARTSPSISAERPGHSNSPSLQVQLVLSARRSSAYLRSVVSDLSSQTTVSPPVTPHRGYRQGTGCFSRVERIPSPR